MTNPPNLTKYVLSFRTCDLNRKNEYAKWRGLRARVLACLTCLRALRAHVPALRALRTLLRALLCAVFACVFYLHFLLQLGFSRLFLRYYAVQRNDCFEIGLILIYPNNHTTLH